MLALWNKVKDILTAPLVGELDTVHLFLALGVVLIGLIVWGFVLRTIALAATEI